MVPNQSVGPDAPDGLRIALDRLGLGEFYSLLSANDIDANAIDELTEADLRELGLTLGQRKRFLRARTASTGLTAARTAPGKGAGG